MPDGKKENAAARIMIAMSAGELSTNRPPARVADRSCWRGSDEVRTGTAVSATAMSTATNDSALAKNTTAALVAASNTPPIAGPTARARFWVTDPNATASEPSAGGTSSGVSVV